jgi:prepilin-type N-terminal cleavage/methylation domain-containing protein
MTKRPAQRGVTLVELLVTIILATIFFAAAVPLFVFAQQQSNGDRARVVAANVAQSKIEAIRGLDYDLVKNLSTVGVDGFGKTWPNDSGGPVKVYSIEYTTTPVPKGAAPGEEDYTLVTVDVYWTPPPKPVKHVVLTTAIYPQSKGPEIVLMTVGRLDGQNMLYESTVHVAARVNALDLAQTGYVLFAVYAANGSMISSEKVTTPDAAGAGWFSWDWNTVAAKAGDGAYTFSAVAVSSTGLAGNFWRLHYVLDAGPPAIPLWSPSGLQAGNGVVSVRWEAPVPAAGDLDHYVLERSINGTVSETSLPKTATTYIDRGLNPNITYSYRVRAVDAHGRMSDWSTPSSATPALKEDTVKPTLGALSATIVGQNVTLSWQNGTDNVGVVLYRLYRDDITMVSPIWIIDSVSGQTTYSYSDPAVGWSSSPIYRLTAVDAALNESDAAVLTATVGAAPVSQKFSLTIQVTGLNGTVLVSNLLDGQVYLQNGQPVTDAKSVAPIVVKANDKKGVVFNPLSYGVYRVVIDFALANGSTIEKTTDIELVRNETVTIPYP